MKNFIYLITFFAIIACNKNDSNLKKISKNFIEKQKTNVGIETHEISCEEFIKIIVKSSNLDVKNQKIYYTQIDRIVDNKINIHVYFENNLSDNPNKKQLVESTIAWMELDINNSTLFNTTVDPDNPVRLNFDKSILENNNVSSACGISKEVKSKSSDRDIKYSILPINFDEYYKSCVYPYDSIICNKNYPKYYYKENDDFAKLIGHKYRPNDYMYLPKLNSFQPVILFNSESDIDSYELIVINNEKVVSSLQIGYMDGETITEFSITESFIINLYKRENTSKKNRKWKSYMINDNGIISKTE